MGQWEVIMFLESQLEISQRYFSIEEIKRGLLASGCSAGCVKGLKLDLVKLCVFERIEFIGVGLLEHRKLYRAKK